jgi:hypothetical protein
VVDRAVEWLLDDFSATLPNSPGFTGVSRTSKGKAMR